MRAAAVAALAVVRDAGAGATLEGRLDDARAPQRAAAARVLGFLRLAAHAPALRAALATDAAAEARAEAARALGRLGDAASMPLLIEALAAPVACLRHAAAQALARLPTDEAAAVLHGRLDDPDPEVRAAAARGLAIVSPGDALVPLCATLANDADPGVRVTAAVALGQLGGEAARAALQRATADPHPEVRDRARAALTQSPR
ncbi:MAG: HEAT repeat domain-containing protein [Myxococcales bacterium]|nr:HEAT repeat domain-containing protein [Myxococcales bacterium]